MRKTAMERRFFDAAKILENFCVTRLTLGAGFIYITPY
jgi:hypothetical protein